MNLADYGPFAAAIAMAAALAASFGFLLTKAVGRHADWRWLSGDPPKVLLRTAAKAPVIALIAWTYATITADNANTFLIFAVVLGVGTAALAVYLQHLVHLHVVDVPVTGPDGKQALDSKHNPMSRRIFIGTERSMLDTARVDYREARAQRGALSIPQFLSGYGNPPYDPEAAWSRSTIAAVRIRMCMFALATVLAAVMSLYLAASSLVAIQVPSGADSAPPPPATSPPAPD